MKFKSGGDLSLRMQIMIINGYKFMLCVEGIDYICHSKSESDLFYIPEIFKWTFKTGFWMQNHLLNLFYSVWNVHIKDV